MRLELAQVCGAGGHAVWSAKLRYRRQTNTWTDAEKSLTLRLILLPMVKGNQSKVVGQFGFERVLRFRLNLSVWQHGKEEKGPGLFSKRP